MQRKSLRFPRRRTRRRTRRSQLSRPSGSCPPYTTFVRKSLRFPRRRTRRRTRRSPLSRPSGSVLQYYTCTTIQRKSLRFPRRCSRRRTRRSPLSRRPGCPPSTTFVLQFTENPSASRAAVRAVARASVPSRSHPPFVFIPVSFSSLCRFHPRFVFTPRL